MGKYVHNHHTNLLAVRFFDFRTATVAFIVSAGTVVVLVVAVAIADVLWNRAFGCAAFDSAPLGILANARFAVSHVDLATLDSLRAAVASIEIAATVVVGVVAVAVALVLGETAFSFTVLIRLVTRILAFALLAVSFFDIVTAAVASIVFAATVVVLVVAVAIADVLWKLACLATAAFVLGILALALFAVSCFDNFALDTLRAAVASIESAATVVVFVVAVAVALELGETAFSFTVGIRLVIRILAFALLAVSFFDSVTAAVASIVFAATVVVLVVAVAIADELWDRAFGLTAFAFVLGIDALALFAVSCFDNSALDRTRTAVASIVFAATVVVGVVAVAVALVLGEIAFSFTVGIRLVIRILAFALLAVSFFDSVTAAVASIVFAATVVVLVVAVAIADELWDRAFGLTAFAFVLGILALALFAVSCFDNSALDRTRTAVAAIESAATVVVGVVAVAVALVLGESAFSVARGPSGNALVDTRLIGNALGKLLPLVAFDTQQKPIFGACFTRRSDAAVTFALVDSRSNALPFDKLLALVACDTKRKPIFGACFTLRSEAAVTFALVDRRSVFNASVLSVRFVPLDARPTNSFFASQCAGCLVGVGAIFSCLGVTFWRALARTTSTTALEVLFKCFTSESTTTLYKPLIARFAVAFQQCQLIVA